MPHLYPNMPRRFPTYPEDPVNPSTWSQTGLWVDIKTDETAVRDSGLLPKDSGLRLIGYPRLGPMLTAYIAKMEWTWESPRKPGMSWPTSYREAALLVHCCWCPTADSDEVVSLETVEAEKLPRGLFCPLLYLDSCDPVVTGREIFGFPKKLAEVHFPPPRPHTGHASGDVVFRGGVVISVNAYQLAEAAPGAAAPMIPWWLEKIIPATPELDPMSLTPPLKQDPRVHELVEVRWLRTALHSVHTTTKVDLLLTDGGDLSDNLSRIPVVGVVGAQLITDEFLLFGSEIKEDYVTRAP